MKNDVMTADEFRAMQDAKRSGGNKYHAVRTIYDGVTYGSKAEAERAAELDLLVRSGEVRTWIGQPKFRLGDAINVYVADFLVATAAGEVWAEDVKGRETSKFRRDKRLWKKHGRIELRVIRREGRRLVVSEIIKGGAAR